METSKIQYIDDYKVLTKRELCDKYQISFYRYSVIQKNLGLKRKNRKYNELVFIDEKEDEGKEEEEEEEEKEDEEKEGKDKDFYKQKILFKHGLK